MLYQEDRLTKNLGCINVYVCLRSIIRHLNANANFIASFETLFVCFIVCLPVCLFYCLFAGLFVLLFVSMIVCLFVCWLLFACLLHCLLVCLLVCLFFVYLSMWCQTCKTAVQTCCLCKMTIPINKKRQNGAETYFRQRYITVMLQLQQMTDKNF